MDAHTIKQYLCLDSSLLARLKGQDLWESLQGAVTKNLRDDDATEASGRVVVQPLTICVQHGSTRVILKLFSRVSPCP